MTTIGRMRRVLTVTGLALVAITAGRSLHAEDRTEVMGTSVRLIVGEKHGAIVDAGLAIDLEPGWKTYWRYPGDSGVPPVIDSAGSVNVAAFSIDYPAPERFREGADQTIGYHGPVVLPLRVTLADPGKPAELHVHAFLGVCRDICVPVDVTLERRVDPTAQPIASEASEIVAAEKRVPVPAKAGEPFSVVRLTSDDTVKPPVASVIIKAPSDALADVFVEGPEGWALPLPERGATTGETTSWRLALDGLPSGAKAHGAALTFTIVGRDRATVQTLTLD